MPARKISLLTLLGLALVLVAGCGTHGYAAALAKPVTVRLSTTGGQSVGSAAFTPIHATRFVAYYKGHQVPLTGATNPVEVRKGSCLGPTVAALSDGVAAQLNTPVAGSPAAIQPDPAGGMDVAIEPGAQWYIVVFDHPNYPSAQIVACGNALSGRQQYFDLYEASRGSAGIALGTALMAPIVATRLDISLTQTVSAQERFAVHEASCGGAEFASGTVAGGGTSGGAIIFRPLDTHNWWLSLTTSAGQTTCSRVSGA
ncbi:MAG TPA: hypothetical protein VJN88_07980 [Ktedonobacterales bacterium]|nr:hypothetical protein [Ktedonobacterales bacterium]